MTPVPSVAKSTLRSIASLGLAALCLVVAACATTVAPADPPQARALAEQVERLYGERRYADALAPAEQALELRRRALGSHLRVAESIDALALVLKALGRQDRAAALYLEAIEMGRREGGPRHPMPTDALDNLAALRAEQGRFREAEAMYQEVLAIDAADGRRDVLHKASTRNNLADLYRRTGRPELAEPLLKEALAVYERDAAPTDWRTASTMGNLANLYLEQRRWAEAEPLLERSLAIAATEGNVSGLAILRGAQGRHDEQAALHERLLASRERRYGSDHPLVANALTNLARSRVLQGRRDEALALLLRAVAVIEPGRTPNEEWWIYGHLARTLGEQAPLEAIYWGKASVAVVQSLRAELTDDRAPAQAQFLRGKAVVFEDLAERLASLGRIAEAQQVLQMLKEHELQELVRGAGGADARTSRTGELSPAERAYGDAVSEARRRRAQSGEGPRDAAEAAFRDAVARAARALQAAGPPAPPAPDAPRTGTAGESRLARSIARHTALEPGSRPVGLQYIAGPDTLWIVLTTPDGVARARPVPVAGAELRTASLRARELARLPDTGTADAQAVLRHLHRWLIEPVEAELQAAGARTLVVSATGALRYVPFAALHDGREYLVQRRAVVVFAEGAAAAEAAEARTWDLAAFGLTRAVDGLPALPGVATELRELAATSGLAVRTWVDDAFSRRALQRALDGDANSLHIASHFVFDGHRPARSRLYLGDGTHLTLADIDAAGWRFDRKQLVTLSVCDSGIGASATPDETGQGSEVEGLAALVQRKGAQAAVMTYWRIADHSSPLFMQRFYAALAAGRGKADPLRDAQLHLLSRRATEHPFHWAGYLVSGNWR